MNITTLFVVAWALFIIWPICSLAFCSPTRLSFLRDENASLKKVFIYFGPIGLFSFWLDGVLPPIKTDGE